MAFMVSLSVYGGINAELLKSPFYWGELTAFIHRQVTFEILFIELSGNSSDWYLHLLLSSVSKDCVHWSTSSAVGLEKERTKMYEWYLRPQSVLIMQVWRNSDIKLPRTQSFKSIQCKKKQNNNPKKLNNDLLIKPPRLIL